MERGDHSLAGLFGGVGRCSAAHGRVAGPPRARIDHVLVSDDALVRKIEVLSGYPTEHQPVVANLGIARAEN